MNPPLGRVRGFLREIGPSFGVNLRFGELAVRLGLLSQERVHEGLWEQARLQAEGEEIPLGQVLVRLGFLTEEETRIVIAATKPIERIGKYRLLRVAGRGGMSIVYEAEDPELRRRVALKVLRDDEGDPAVLRRFQREGEIAAQLRHPNIIAVHEVGASGDPEGRPLHYIAFDFVEGTTLADLMTKRATPRADLLRMLEESTRAVAYAHSKGVVHRDLKPSNILVGSDGRVVLTDFGLAHAELFESRLTRSSAILGTPAYMAPEQVQGRTQEVDERTDVYALGVILYEILTGSLPFTGKSPDRLFHEIVNEDPPRPTARSRNVDPEIETVCLKALEKDRRNRYVRALDLANDLDRYRRGDAVLARPPSTLRRLRRWLSRRTTILAAAAALLMAATAVFVAVEAGRRTRKAEERTRARDEALRLIEQARPALDQATQYLYDREMNYDELVLRAEKARALLEEAVAKAPDLSTGHYLLGQAWEILGWWDRAEASWRKAIELDPMLAPARFRLGRLLMLPAYLRASQASNETRLRMAAGAEVAIREGASQIEMAVRQGTGFDDALQADLAEATYACFREDKVRLQELVRRALEKYGSARGTEEFHFLSETLESMPAGQMEALERALRIRPRFLMALCRRAALHHDLGNLIAALNDWTEAIRIHPRFAVALVNRSAANLELGQRFQANGREEEAGRQWDLVIADCDRADSIDPSYSAIYSNRSAARFYKGDLDGAIADGTRAIALEPQSLRAHNNRGTAHHRNGERHAAAGRRDAAVAAWEAAIADFSEAIRINPQVEAPYVDRAIAYRSMGDLDASLADCTEALRLEPDSSRAYFHRAKTHEARRDFSSAVADYTEAIQRNGSDASYFYGRAFCRFATTGANLVDVVDDCSRAIALRPGYGFAYGMRAFAHEKIGKVREAVEDARAALKCELSDGQRKEMAALLERLGEQP